jgi:predicted HTH transcriptional regulator
MINRNVEQITKDDLQSLIDNKVTERKTMEYKQALPGNSDKQKKEFLADVSSFANASGGVLIYGITEDKKTGKPKALVGLDIVNIDQETLRLDNVIRTGLQPRLPAVNISPPITLDNSNSTQGVQMANTP